VAATGIYGFSGNIAVEGGTPISPSGEITPTKPNNPAEPDPTAPPRITNVQVYEHDTSTNNAVTQYNGNGTVYFRDGNNTPFGEVSNGKLSLVFPYPVPVTVWTLESFTERSENTVELTRNITLSNSTTKGFVMSDLGFLEDGGSDRASFGFVRDINRQDANSGSCTYVSYLYVDKQLTITGTLNWKEVVTGTNPQGTWTETTECDEQWNLTLEPGWNKVQREFSRTDDANNDMWNVHEDITEVYTNVPNDDTSGFQWTINPLTP
jgi:hypothetical protein